MVTQILKYRAIEIKPQTTSGATPIPDQQDLREAHIVALEVYTENDITGSPQTGTTIMTLADMKLCVLQLYVGDVQLGQDYPLLNLHRMQNASNDPFNRDQALFNDMTITWDKCKLVPVGGALSSIAKVVPIGVYYWLDVDMDKYLYAEAQKEVTKRKMISEIMNKPQ